MNTKKWIQMASLTVLAIVTMGVAQSALAEDYVVIVNSDNPIEGIEASELQKVFLGKSTTWDDGSRYAVTLGEYDDPAVSAFLSTVVKKSSKQFEGYWRKKLFSGSGTPPKVQKSVSQVVKFVGSEPGAIGIVPAGTKLGDFAKVISVN